MPRSYAQTSHAPCPACGRSAELEVWLIVDRAERPDLVERLRAGTLHTLPCPHCGHASDVNAPLLVHDPARQHLLFAPPRGTSREQDRRTAADLIQRLTANFLHPRPTYLNQALPVPRALLPGLLDADDPRAALEGIAAQAPLLKKLEQFVTAETWAASRRAVQRHPELLTEDADLVLGALLEASREQGDAEAATVYQEHRTLLRRCREIGEAAAFAAKMEESEE